MTVGKASPQGFLMKTGVSRCMPALAHASGVRRLQHIEIDDVFAFMAAHG
jgi:hypothetical protein